MSRSESAVKYRGLKRSVIVEFVPRLYGQHSSPKKLQAMLLPRLYGQLEHKDSSQVIVVSGSHFPKVGVVAGGYSDDFVEPKPYGRRRIFEWS